MTVNTTRNIIRAIADGVETIFPYDFLVYDELHLRVSLGNLVSDPADYTVAGIAAPQGGTVTFLIAPDDLVQVTIERTLPLTQLLDYNPYDPFPAEAHEGALDRLTMITQQLNADIQDGLADINFRGVWATAEVYLLNDIIQWPDELGAYYVCRVEHTAGVDFEADLANGLWVLYIDLSLILESTQLCVDSAAAAAASEAAALESEAAALASANDAQASEDAALASEQAAAVSEANAHTSELDARNSWLNSHNWASEAEDIPVIDVVNPIGFSAFHWAKKAEAIVQTGGVDPAGELITPNVDFITDLNSHDFSAHRLASPTIPTAILIEVFNTLDIGYGGEVYRYYGAKPVTIGLGAPPQILDVWALTSTSIASGISFLDSLGYPIATNVQDAIDVLSLNDGRWNFQFPVISWALMHIPGAPPLYWVDTDVLTVTLPADGTVPPGSVHSFGGSTGNFIFDTATNGQNIAIPEERVASLRGQNSVMTLTYIGTDNWLLYGDLGLETL